MTCYTLLNTLKLGYGNIKIDQSNINHTDQQLQKQFVVFEAAVCILLRFHVNGQRHQWCIDQLKNVVENTSLLQILGSNCLL